MLQAQESSSSSNPPTIRVVDKVPFVPGGGVSLYDAPVYLHTSTFQSQNLELSIRSPDIKLLWRQVEDLRFAAQPIPVFRGKDSVGGTVTTPLHSMIGTEHRLTISIEGAFFWISPQNEEIDPSLPHAPPPPERIKHVFLSSSIAITISPENMRSRSQSQDGGDGKRRFFRRYRRKAASETGHETAASIATGTTQDRNTTHSFSFPLPILKESRDKEAPSTFQVSRLRQGRMRGRWFAEGAQIAYKLVVRLEPKNSQDDEQHTYEEVLEAPIIIEHENLERAPEPPRPDSWNHYELVPLTPADFVCTISLPKPLEFARSDLIPFYLFVTTFEDSQELVPSLVKESIIRVSIIRLLHLDSGMAFQAPEPRTRYPEDETAKSEKSSRKRKGRARSFLHRMSTRTPQIFKWNRKSKQPPPSESEGLATGTNTTHASKEKPLPELPEEPDVIHEEVIFTTTSEGFPKRVGRRSLRSSYQPAVIANSNGVYKGELRLRNELLNSISWPGISVTYFIEAMVYFRDTVLRTRKELYVIEPYLSEDS